MWCGTQHWFFAGKDVPSSLPTLHGSYYGAYYSKSYLRFLENKLHFPDGFWCGKSVLDLGAGTGVTGLAAGTLG